MFTLECGTKGETYVLNLSIPSLSHKKQQEKIHKFPLERISYRNASALTKEYKKPPLNTY
jgi:hypothetical protein